MIPSNLKRLKDQRKLTVHEISELSGVPESTITRILSGQTTDPGFKTVCDIVKALGGSVDDIIGIKRKLNFEESTAVMLYKQQLEETRKWIKRLFTLLCIIIGFLILFVLMDLIIPNSGWIQK